MFYFTEKNSCARKNPEKHQKHLSKNRKFGKLVFFPLDLLTKGFLISNVIGSFLVVSNWQRSWHPLNANWAKGSSVGESNPIT